MCEGVLRQRREKICTRQCVMTLHAEGEMNDDTSPFSMRQTTPRQMTNTGRRASSNS